MPGEPGGSDARRCPPPRSPSFPPSPRCCASPSRCSRHGPACPPLSWSGPRAPGRLFTLLSAVSLVLCIAVAVLWARAGEHTHEWVWPPDDRVFRTYGIRSAREGVEVWLEMDPWTLVYSAHPYEPPHGRAWPL